jgi:hypothetical protein
MVRIVRRRENIDDIVMVTDIRDTVLIGLSMGQRGHQD